MKYIFFNFYNKMYQDGKPNAQKFSEWNAYSLVATATIFWCIVIGEFYYFDIENVELPENYRAIGFFVLILILVLLYFLLLFDNRYKKIYNQFSHLNTVQRKLGLIISFCYFFLPIFIGAFITLKWHGKI